MAANSSAGRVPLVIWAATVDPAYVPMMRSASVTSTCASERPAMSPSSHALPAAPPPARTKARAPAVEVGVVFMGVALRELPVEGSQLRLPQFARSCPAGSTRCGYRVHGTHLPLIDHDRRDVSRAPTPCAIGNCAGCCVLRKRA